MNETLKLALRIRQAVQGCTLHPHGPVQTWAAIEKAHKSKDSNYNEVAKLAIQSCLNRIENLKKLGVDETDQRIIKEIKTKSFIEDLFSSKVENYKKTPPLTVDAIIVYPQENNQIVLIERKNEPLGWALPGGFVDIGETTEQAVMREVFEETHLKISEVKLFNVYSDPQRDPRGHNVTVVYSGIASGPMKAKDDAKKVALFSLDKLPEMAFDHKKILQDFVNNKK